MRRPPEAERSSGGRLLIETKKRSYARQALAQSEKSPFGFGRETGPIGCVEDQSRSVLIFGVTDRKTVTVETRYLDAVAFALRGP